MSEHVTSKVSQFLDNLLPEMGLELFDIQFRREGHGWILRVFIDSVNGVELEHCSKVSRELSYYLDVEDLIDHAYNLEVSSPGLERPLRSIEDFCRYVGKNARVKLSAGREGQKIFEGVIEKVHVNEIDMRMKDRSLLKFSYEELNKARLTV